MMKGPRFFQSWVSKIRKFLIRETYSENKDESEKFQIFKKMTFIEFLFNTTYSGRSGVVRFQEALLNSDDTKSFAKTYCEKKLKNDIAMVEVVMDSPTFIKYIQTHKATTTDKLANFGTE